MNLEQATLHPKTGAPGSFVKPNVAIQVDIDWDNQKVHAPTPVEDGDYEVMTKNGSRYTFKIVDGSFSLISWADHRRVTVRYTKSLDQSDAVKSAGQMAIPDLFAERQKRERGETSTAAKYEEFRYFSKRCWISQ
jgi:hypothetical protein